MTDTGQQAALRDAVRTIAGDPQRADHYARLADLLLRSGRSGAAAGALRRAVALRPDWQEGWHTIALIEAASGQVGQAIATLRRSAGGDPALPAAADLACLLGGTPRRHPPAAGPLRVLYRISDGGYPKPKIADKRTCLRNFLAVIAPEPGAMSVVADNCGPATLAMIAEECRRHYGRDGAVAVHETALGNGPSWIFARNLALEQADGTAVYFVEDDYLHRPGSAAALFEALERADYVSLYDHADKYRPMAEGGNPLIAHGGELTRLIVTASSHWKFTLGTTMTFATRVGTLREDRALFDRFADRRHPDDFRIFINLIVGGRTVLTPVPGLSTHGEPDYLSPAVDWEAVAAPYRDGPGSPA